MEMEGVGRGSGVTGSGGKISARGRVSMVTVTGMARSFFDVDVDRRAVMRYEALKTITCVSSAGKSFLTIFNLSTTSLVFAPISFKNAETSL